MSLDKPRDFSVEFREGASNESEIDKKQTEAERIKNAAPFDLELEHLDDVFESKKEPGPLSETLIIKPDGTFDKAWDQRDANGKLLWFGVTMAATTPAELYEFARKAQEKRPEYHFEFETDPEGKWMKYSVSRTS